MSKYSLNRKNAVSSRAVGTTITELPVALGVIFIGFGVPLLALSMSCIRFGLFWEACREAADSAAQAQYFADNSTSPGQGAVALAINTANNVAAMFPGISINSQNGGSNNGVNCYIVTTPITSTNTSTVSPANTCLTSPADLTKNIYQIRVDVSGAIQPIIPAMSAGNNGILPALPGLNQPMPITMSQLRVYENGPGLSLYAGNK